MFYAKFMAVAALTLFAGSIGAQGFPDRPVRIIVPFSPGGATDIVARLVGRQLGETWGQTVVIDNRAGAGGNIGADLAAKATADGYTLLFPSGSVLTANPHIYRKLSFDAAQDFLPITNVASGPQVVAVANGVPAKTIAELIALTKKTPLNFGSAGIGSQVHLAAENLLYSAGVNATHVPYKGEGPALADLAGGQIHWLTPNLSAGIGFVNSGKIRALAVTSKTRIAQLPNVPAVAETLPGFENLGWFGLVAPKGTPPAVIKQLHADTVKLLASEDIRKRFNELGMVPVGNTPAEFDAAIRAETARWAGVVRERKLTLD
jgi:tripartite-type tricarboxylate transporter receptor subunit TctC